MEILIHTNKDDNQKQKYSSLKDSGFSMNKHHGSWNEKFSVGRINWYKITHENSWTENDNSVFVMFSSFAALFIFKLKSANTTHFIIE